MSSEQPESPKQKWLHGHKIALRGLLSEKATCIILDYLLEPFGWFQGFVPGMTFHSPEKISGGVHGRGIVLHHANLKEAMTLDPQTWLCVRSWECPVTIEMHASRSRILSVDHFFLDDQETACMRLLDPGTRTPQDAHLVPLYYDANTCFSLYQSEVWVLDEKTRTLWSWSTTDEHRFGMSHFGIQCDVKWDGPLVLRVFRAYILVIDQRMRRLIVLDRTGKHVRTWSLPENWTDAVIRDVWIHEQQEPNIVYMACWTHGLIKWHIQEGWLVHVPESKGACLILPVSDSQLVVLNGFGKLCMFE